jgi:hypothetical protein
MQSRQWIGAGIAKALPGAILALVVLVLAPAGAAAATTRHASPAGTGSTCSTELPCSVTEALAKSESGDTVVMASDEGSYGSTPTPLGATLQLHSGISLEGAPGQLAQIYSSAPNTAIRMEGGAGQRLANVAIHYEGTETALRGAGTVERVLALGTIAGCELGPETVLVDSVCTGQFAVYENVGGSSPWPVTLRNDTLYGTERGLVVITDAAGLQVNAFNTVIHGGVSDIQAVQSLTGTVTVALDHSNYISGESQGGASVTPAGSGTNQTAAPQFVNAAANDFAELESSPTIDAGLNDPANGLFDVLGNPRTLNVRGTCPAMTDIGAYEFNANLVVDCFFDPPPKKETTKKSIKIVKPGHNGPKSKAKPAISVLTAKIRKRRATFRFAGSSGTVGFECKLDKKHFRACKSPKVYKRLKPGKHEFSVRAIDAKGKHSKPATREFRIRKKSSAHG